MAIDVAMHIGLGKFFACKLRAGALFSIYEKTGDVIALEQSITAYKTARGYWAKLADQAKGVYKSDLTAGEWSYLRGHWLDRLPVMDEDIEHITAMQRTPSMATRDEKTIAAVNRCMQKPERLTVKCQHKKLASFKPGHDIEVEISFEKMPQFAKLYYRHVNHAERYMALNMQSSGNKYKAVIPAEYTNSPYSIAYYFELGETKNAVTLYPGLGAELTQQPYFIVRKAV